MYTHQYQRHRGKIDRGAWNRVSEQKVPNKEKESKRESWHTCMQNKYRF